MRNSDYVMFFSAKNREALVKVSFDRKTKELRINNLPVEKITYRVDDDCKWYLRIETCEMKCFFDVTPFFDAFTAVSGRIVDLTDEPERALAGITKLRYAF